MFPNKAIPSNLSYGFYQKFVAKIDWGGCAGETPTGESRGRTARGKRVPGSVINVQIVQAIKKLKTNLIFIEFVFSLSPPIDGGQSPFIRFLSVRPYRHV
jgi:hypothetical protein